MTNKRTTKQALVASAILLCMTFTMLLGTTFAWFTDSATSAGNKIVAGTLDVQLWMYDESESDYVNIGDKATPIFGAADSLAAKNDAKDTLWEPGKTQVVYLKLVNAGSLDLKYTVAINVRDNADDKDLYKALEYAIAPNAKQSDTELPAWNGGTKVNVGNNVDTTDVELPAKEEGSNAHEHCFALSVHMLEEAGNEYQGGYVEFDVKVAATQLASEEDSFGNQYDVNAEFPVVGTGIVPENAQTPTQITAGKVGVDIPAAAPAGAYTVSVTNEKETNNADGKTVFSADINLLKDGVKVEGNGTVKYIVKINLGPDKAIAEVLHKGVAIPDYDYDAQTGILSFETDSFSPFAVVYEVKQVVKVDSAEAFAEALANVTEKTEIDATGVTVVPTDDIATTFVIPAGVTVKGATFAPNGSCWLLIGEGEQAVAFEDCAFVGLPLDQFKIATKGCDDITYTNCTFTGFVMINNSDNRDAINTFNDCNFGLTNGFMKCGYVNCMAATNIFNQCNFNYTGGSTMGSNQFMKWNAVNSYSENTNTRPESNYTTYVELNGCALTNCATYKNTANSTLVVK